MAGIGGRCLTRPLTLSLAAGAIHIHGPNGCGKSTLLRTLAGILPPMAGRIRLAGHDLARDDLRAKSVLGYMADRIPLPLTASASELLQLSAWARASAEDLALSPLGRRLEIAAFQQRPVGQLSLGQRRRVSLVAALAHDPLVALLDEPVAGLDRDGMGVLADIIRERSARGWLTLFSDHEDTLSRAVQATIVPWQELAPVSP